MPFLDQQVKIVNDYLRKTALADARFESGRFEGIANEINRRENDKIVTFPGLIVYGNNDALEITPDDTYPIIIYHKVISKLYKTLNASNEFGDGYKNISETVQLRMIVYAKWDAVKITQEQLEALITTNFPDTLLGAAARALKLQTITATLKSSNFRSQQLWNEEYKNIETRLAPEDIFFAINYDIDSMFRKGCYSICDCNTN